MKLVKKPIVYSIAIFVLSLFYGMVFVLISGNTEFIKTLPKGGELDHFFLDRWIHFANSNHLKWIGLAIIAISAVILIKNILSIIKYKRFSYDEYEFSIICKGIFLTWLLSIVLVLLLMGLVLSNNNYTTSCILGFILVDWGISQIVGLKLVLEK